MDDVQPDDLPELHELLVNEKGVDLLVQFNPHLVVLKTVQDTHVLNLRHHQHWVALHH